MSVLTEIVVSGTPPDAEISLTVGGADYMVSSDEAGSAIISAVLIGLLRFYGCRADEIS